MNVRFIAATALVAVTGVGCQNMSHTEAGAGLGGLLGAGVGAAIADANGGKAGKGALIGAAAGALGGGLIGNAEDKAEKRQIVAQRDAAVQASARSTMGITDVVSMSQQQIGDQIIINQIRSSGTVYQLSPNDLAYLKQNGVSDAVVMEMQQTAARRPVVYRRSPPPPLIVHEAPVYVAPAPVYVVPGPPPPRVSLGVSYSSHRH
ncbi:MAG TPA: glycine zipper domain-containing protein [Planctomycetia bacterium]|jgi:uncharacterized protein YcfJ|nr:glycine zipper domain-containing protein [Planctomycetia bacterium]